MKVLLLGGTGYLGGNIAHGLVRSGCELTCVVRKSSDTSRIDNLRIQYISNEMDELEIFLRHNHMDWVINSVCTYKANNSLYGDLLSSNLIFPLSVLNLAVKHNVKNYITIGTSLPELLNIYSFAKSKFGQFGEYLSKKDGINFADLQLEMFYGGMFEPDNRFMSSCKKKMLKNEPIELTEGTQKRDIIRVEDVIGVISSLIKKEYVKGYEVLPVGSGEQHTLREIMEYLKMQLKSSSDLEFGAIPSREGEPDTKADIRWYREIGYCPKWSFFDGLKSYALE